MLRPHIPRRGIGKRRNLIMSSFAEPTQKLDRVILRAAEGSRCGCKRRSFAEPTQKLDRVILRAAEGSRCGCKRRSFAEPQDDTINSLQSTQHDAKSTLQKTCPRPCFVARFSRLRYNRHRVASEKVVTVRPGSWRRLPHHLSEHGVSIQQPMENSEFSKPPATLDELIGRLPRSFTEAEILMIRNAYDLAAEAHAAVPANQASPTSSILWPWPAFWPTCD